MLRPDFRISDRVCCDPVYHAQIVQSAMAIDFGRYLTKNFNVTVLQVGIGSRNGLCSVALGLKRIIRQAGTA